MRIELFRALDDALVLGVCLAHLYLDYDGLLHLGGDHVADLLITPRGCRRRLLRFLSRHLACSLSGICRGAVITRATDAQCPLTRHGLDLSDLLAQLAEFLDSVV